MLGLGIRRIEDFCPHPAGMAGRLRARFLKNGRLSYQLLRTATPASAREIEVFEAIMRQMRLASGVYRTTFRGRFRDLDASVNAMLGQRFTRDSGIHIHDWAASDCLTSAEWASALFAQFPNATLEASDLALFLVEVELPGSAVAILEPGGEALQYVHGPFVIQLHPPEPRRLLVNRVLAVHAQMHLDRWRGRLHLPPEWLDSPENSLSAPPLTFRKIPLIHPEAAALSAQEPRFTITRHSAFAVIDEPADVIRSMNIFNRAYFPEERLLAAARAVWRSLRTLGWWIVGRTVEDDPPVHSASVLEKSRDGFRVIQRHGGGSELEPLAMEAAASEIR